MPEIDAQPIIELSNPRDISDRQLYYDALSSFLQPYVQKAVSDWYQKNSKFRDGTVDPWQTKILSIERSPEHNFIFIIKVEAFPYILAHITVGREQITFKLGPNGDVTMIKFEHIETIDDWIKYRFPQPTSATIE